MTKAANDQTAIFIDTVYENPTNSATNHKNP